MDRRAFLSGLFGVVGVAALGGLTMEATQAAPIARALDPSDIKPDSVAEAGRTPDGSAVEKAQYYYGDRRYYGRRRRRGHYRRRSRVVCRTYWRRGRPFRTCHRVGW